MKRVMVKHKFQIETFDSGMKLFKTQGQMNKSQEVPETY